MNTVNIETLRHEYAAINSIDPALPTYGKLCATLDQCSNDQLRFLAGAGIKWVSVLANNRCIRRDQRRAA